MHAVRATTNLLLAIIVTAGCASSTDSAPTSSESDAPAKTAATANKMSVRREVSDGVFRSSASPAIDIKVDPDFTYVGVDKFVLKKKAAVERYHWVKANDGLVEAIVVFQFERFLPGVLGRYRFRIPSGKELAGSNYRYSPKPVRLGNADYVHNTWAFNNRNSAEKNPNAESARTLKMLSENGYRLDDEVIMSRYVRAVGTDKRKELILFYIEPLRVSDQTLEAFPDEPEESDAYDSLSAAVTARGEEAFEVLSRP